MTKMKIVFLNTWHGKMSNNLRAFIESQRVDTDAFCFMETNDHDTWRVCHGLLLQDYQIVKCYKKVGEHDFALATYVRRNLRIASKSVLLQDDVDTGLALVTQLKVGERDVFICNVHGVSQPGDKLDTPGRLKQSSGIIDFLSDKNGTKIIGGDFNLIPNTESVDMFERVGYQNLIKDYGVKSTRNHLAWDRFPGNEQMYADFTFVTPDVRVRDFSVPACEASDHLPQILDVAL